MPNPRQARARVAQAISIPPPVGGLNLIESQANMPETDALVLDNYIARSNAVELRRGFASHATGMVSAVESIMPYEKPGSKKLFAAAGTSFFDVTASGAVGAAVQTLLTNARWESINVATSGGQFLYAVNGVDAPRLWDGTTWQTVTDVSAPIAITGVTTTTLSHILLHQNRLWFLQTNTLLTWYLGINSVGGVATAFDLRTVAKLGGSVIAFDTWTVDSGSGSDDVLAFITSEGEVIVYAGTDPASISAWQLQGIYRIGRPPGKRCTLKLRGDLLILGEGGVIPLSQLIQSGAERPSYITYRIQPEIGQRLADFLDVFGSEMLYFQRESLGIINSPESSLLSKQYVWDVTTSAWCRWTGLNAICFKMFNGSPFMGVSGGIVHKLWGSQADNGAAITGSVKPAFSRLGYPERKNLRRIRIYFSSESAVKFGMRINRDFEDVAPTSITLSGPSGSGGVWDTDLWDTGVWGGLLLSSAAEVATGVIGTYLTPYIVTQSMNIGIKINGYDHVYEAGGFT